MDKPPIKPPEAASESAFQSGVEAGTDWAREHMKARMAEGKSEEDAVLSAQLVISLASMIEAVSYTTKQRNHPAYTKAMVHAISVVAVGLGVAQDEVHSYITSVNATAEAYALREKLMGRR